MDGSYRKYNDLDQEGGYYFNARWYDPNTGRFITEDPIKDSSLWFAYVNNNPMKYIDPTGMRESEHGNQYDDENARREAEEAARKAEEEARKAAEEEAQKNAEQSEKKVIQFYGSGVGVEGSIMAGRYGEGRQGGQATKDWFDLTFYNTSTNEAFTASFESYTVDSKGFSVTIGANTISIEGFIVAPEGMDARDIAGLLTTNISGTMVNAAFFGTGGFSNEDGSIQYSVGTFGLSAGVPFSFATDIKSKTKLEDNSFQMLTPGEPTYWEDKKDWMSRP